MSGWPGGACDATIPRPALEAALRGGEAGVVVLQAPAGYGKTTALRSLERRLRLDGETVLAPSLADPGALVQAAAARPCALLIDDCDEADPEQAAVLRRLAHGCRPGFRLVLAARSTLRLGTTRLAAHGSLRLLLPADLRLPDDGAAEMLDAVCGPMDPSLRTAILRMADGWPVALRLAGEMARSERCEPGDFAARLVAPGGLLHSYLFEEIFSPEDQERRDLMLATGALGTFDADLAACATGLAGLEDSCLRLRCQTGLLSDDPEQPERVRYHPLVAAFLDATLRRADPARHRQIHRAAAAWHAERGEVVCAIPHAFAGDDAEHASKLLAAASDRRERIGRWRTFIGWVARLPSDKLERLPEIRIEAAVSHAVLAEFPAARRHAEAARSEPRLRPAANDDLLAADAVIAGFSDDTEAAMRAGEIGIAKASGQDAYTVGALKSALALGWLGRGHPERARHAAIEGLAVHQNGGSVFGQVFCAALIGQTYAVEGELRRAVEVWQASERLIRGLSTGPAMEAIAVGYMVEACYEQGQLAEAETYKARCLNGATEAVLPDIATSIYLAGSRAAQALGREAKAARLLDEAEIVGLRRGWPRLVHAAAWQRVTFALNRGDLPAARRARDDLAQDSRCGVSWVQSYHATIFEGGGLGELRFRAEAEPDRALLTDIRKEAAQARAGRRVWRAVRLALIEAVARENTGDRHGALRAAQRALELGLRMGLRRTFADAGRAVAPLLQVVASEQPAVGGVDASAMSEVLAECGVATERREAPGEVMLESLSRRELDVLRLAATGLSNRELAARLFLTENTIKWHLQHVFSKLGVRNRTRAIAVARDLRLIA